MEGTVDPAALVELLKGEDSASVIEQLKRTKEELIESMRFEEVLTIDSAIELHAKMSLDEILNRLKVALDGIVDKIYEKYEVDAQKTSDRSRQREVEVRATIDKSYQDMKQRHVNELTEVAIEREFALGAEKRRPCAKSLEMIEQAKKLARAKDVQKAIDMRTAAKEYAENDLQKRLRQVEVRFEKIVTGVLAKQEAELIALQNEFVRLVQEANKNVKGEIVWHQKRAVAMIRLELSKAITNGRKVLKDKSKYSIVSQSLTDFLQEKLTRENRGYIFRSVQ